MPISKKYIGMFKSMQKQYCTAKYGKAGIKDKKVQGIPSCPKGRGVFYATAKKKGIDYKGSLSGILSLNELIDLAVEGIIDGERNSHS